MGFWNDGIRSGTRSRSRSPSRRGPYGSRPSFARSASSFFSLGGSSSRGHGYGHSRARPREGFMNRIRKFLRDVYSYLRRNPVKVFLLVIMPLITGGALTKILGQFGVRLPASLQRFAGGQRGYSESERFYARGGARDFAGGMSLPGMASSLGGGLGGGLGGSLGSLIGIAKMFL